MVITTRVMTVTEAIRATLVALSSGSRMTTGKAGELPAMQITQPLLDKQLTLA